MGFKHWHPVSVAEKGGKLCGQSDLGGVWEWTSTVLEKHEGFKPMELYPGYSGLCSLSYATTRIDPSQRTSSMASTTSRLEVRGQRILASLGERHS